MKFNYFLIDIEGTLVKDKTFTPVNGAVRWLNRLSIIGKQFFLVTNNTTHTPEELYRLLIRKGFSVAPEQVVSCITAGTEYLYKSKCKRCFVIGSPAIKRCLLSRDIKVTNSADVDAVVVGLDEKLNFTKLRTATTALVKNNARLCAMHTNRLYVDNKGRVSFSSGPIVKALEYASRRKAYISGKPSPQFYKRFLSNWRCRPSEVLMVSDDPFSDLKGARKLGMKTCFVASGAYPDIKVINRLNKESKPDYAFKTVASIKY